MRIECSLVLTHYPHLLNYFPYILLTVLSNISFKLNHISNMSVCICFNIGMLMIQYKTEYIDIVVTRTGSVRYIVPKYQYERITYHYHIKSLGIPIKIYRTFSISGITSITISIFCYIVPNFGIPNRDDIPNFGTLYRWYKNINILHLTGGKAN